MGPHEPCPDPPSARRPDALSNQVPRLAKALAWRSLGAVAETPVHWCALTSPAGTRVTLAVKVERRILAPHFITLIYY